MNRKELLERIDAEMMVVMAYGESAEQKGRDALAEHWNGYATGLLWARRLIESQEGEQLEGCDEKECETKAERGDGASTVKAVHEKAAG